MTQHAETLAPGATLAGRFRIESAAGGELRATDAQTGGAVVLRVFPSGGWSPAAREGFRRRAEAAARVSHPNLAVLVGAGADDALPAEWVAWETLVGEPLSALLAQRGTPPASLALRIVGEAASGIGAAHAVGMAHGGVHPGALFLSRGEADQRMRVRVTGFGVYAGVDVRSAAARYAAPEALRRQGPPTPAGDVWSLGVVAFELLAGLPPQWGATLAALARGQDARVPSPRDLRPEIAEPVAAAVLRALSADPAARFADAAAFAAALAAPVPPPVVIEPEPEPEPEPVTVVEAPPPAPAYAPRRAPRFVPPQREPNRVMIGGMAVAAALAAAAAWAAM